MSINFSIILFLFYSRNEYSAVFITIYSFLAKFVGKIYFNRCLTFNLNIRTRTAIFFVSATRLKTVEMDKALEKWKFLKRENFSQIERNNGVDAMDSKLILHGRPFKYSRVYLRCIIILCDKMLFPNVTYTMNIKSNCRVRHSLSGTCS